jgi:hypothetical protein
MIRGVSPIGDVVAVGSGFMVAGVFGARPDDDMFHSQNSRYPINLNQDTATELLPIWNDPDYWAAKRLEGIDLKF